MVLQLSRGASQKEIAAINEKLRELPAQKTIDAKKYCGVIKLQEDPLIIQQKLRNDWE